MTFRVPEKHRVTQGIGASDRSYGNNGAFLFPAAPGRARLMVSASDGEGWEHVSVSSPVRCPTWEEMCLVKDLFWRGDEAVMQLHPPKADYVNNHAFCLHLWRPTEGAIPLPPSILVGIKTAEPVPLTAYQAAIARMLFA
jgi:hypothetical protein